MTQMQLSEHLSISRDDAGVVTLLLDNPTRRNAMSDRMTSAWTAAMTALRTDRTVRAVVVTGAGDAFCSGGDHEWLATMPDNSVDALRTRMLAFYRSWLSIRDLEVPTISAVNGAAVGAGLCLALATDLCYVADEAKLTAPFTKLGLHSGMAATWLLPQSGGIRLAREMLLTGRVVTGATAAAEGLVNRSFPRERLLGEVARIAGDIAACAPIPTRLTKVALVDGGHASSAAALQWEAMAQPISMATEDLREGLAAAKERRPARFLGR
jgi:enoyl-CoA hydratase